LANEAEQRFSDAVNEIESRKGGKNKKTRKNKKIKK
jgi:hypothetical protein